MTEPNHEQQMAAVNEAVRQWEVTAAPELERIARIIEQARLDLGRAAIAFAKQVEDHGR